MSTYLWFQVLTNIITQANGIGWITVGVRAGKTNAELGKTNAELDVTVDQMYSNFKAKIIVWLIPVQDSTKHTVGLIVTLTRHTYYLKLPSEGMVVYFKILYKWCDIYFGADQK